MPRLRARDRRGLVVALGVLAASAPRADASAPAALAVTAEPPRIVLGRDEGAELRISAPEGVDEVSLSASAGEIRDVRRLPEGGFAARLVAPEGRVPQVAIVAAVARTPGGTATGWTAIPCAGRARARVRARPGARVALTIGGRRFGPRTAGPDGVAVIPIVVPPGVREAHHEFTPFDLGVPETPLVHAILDLDHAPLLADRPERVRVLAWVVAPHGTARAGDVPAFEPSRGTVAVTERRPGEIEAVWALPPGLAGEERLVVRLPAAPASRSELTLDTVPGAPAVVAVSFDGAGAFAGDPEGAGVTVRVLDAGGNPVPAGLEVAAEGAELSGAREPEPGLLVARLRAPASLRGRAEATVRASAPAAGISGARTLPLLPGPAALARLEAPPGPARAGRVATLALRVTDAGGNPASETGPAVSARGGKVLAVEAQGAGRWRVRWAAPDVAAPARARLVATLGAARAEAVRTVLPPRPRAALLASAGTARALDGASRAAARAGVAVDLAAAESRTPPLGLELAWRAELEVLDAGSGPGLCFLGGGSASRVLGPTLVVRASASAGALLAGGAAAPAARLAIQAGLERRGIAPFVEAALLGASGGGPGALAAVTVSGGIRVGVERR